MDIFEGKQYVVITNRKQVLSTINGDKKYRWPNENIMNLAGFSTWKKDNFYPLDGMVGNVICKLYNNIDSSYAIIILIDDKFYVPITELGIKYISEQEMLIEKSKSKKEYSIPESILNFQKETTEREANQRDYANYGFFGSLNDCREGFANELGDNYKHIAVNFKNGTILDVLIMSENYAVQMALEYKKQAGFLPESIIMDIINQVGDALKMILPSVITPKFLEDLSQRSLTKLQRFDIVTYIENYWRNFSFSERHY